MFTKTSSTQLFISYGMIASGLMGGKNFFDSDDYKNSEQLTRNLLDKLIPYCDDFVGIIKGCVNKCEVLGFIRTMSFPKRFLKFETMGELPENQRQEVERILEQAFFLGLTLHFFVWTSPTRKEFDKVNFDNLIKGWFNKTLLADKGHEPYNQKLYKIPDSFFNYYYNQLLEPFFQTNFKFGYLKRGECYAYFHNLFYAGVLLGVHLDAATSKQ